MDCLFLCQENKHSVSESVWNWIKTAWQERPLLEIEQYIWSISEVNSKGCGFCIALTLNSFTVTL